MTHRTLVPIAVAAALMVAAGVPAPAAPAPAAPATGTPAPAGPTLTLDQAIQDALTRNPQVVSAQDAVAAARQAVALARTGLAPTISLSGTVNYGTSSATTVTPSGVTQVLPGPQGTGSVSFVGAVPLFDSGRTSAQVASAEAGLTSAEAALRLTAQSIAVQTATAFLNVLSAERLTDVRQAQLAQVQAQLALTQAKVRAGVAAQSDVIQAQAAVAQAQVNLLSAQAAISTDKASLQALLAADVAAPVEVQAPPAPPPSVTVTFDAVLQQALANRPEIAAAQAQVRSAQAGLDLARVNAGPQLSIGVNTAYTPVSTSAALSNAVSYGLGGTVSLPLFDAGRGQAGIRQAQAQLQGAQAALSNAELSVRQDAYQAYLSAVQAAATVTATVAAQAAADQALAVSEGRYRAGVTMILEVTTAQATAAQAEVNAVSALYSYEIALATLRHAEGMPIQVSTVGGPA